MPLGYSFIALGGVKTIPLSEIGLFYKKLNYSVGKGILKRVSFFGKERFVL